MRKKDDLFQEISDEISDNYGISLMGAKEVTQLSASAQILRKSDCPCGSQDLFIDQWMNKLSARVEAP